MNKGWVGVDLDGTLAYYDKFKGFNVIGEPIPTMLEKVQNLIDHGITVKIFTARATDAKNIPLIEKWCKKHFGVVLPVTNSKDMDMIELWDDRARQVLTNTGIFLDELLFGDN